MEREKPDATPMVTHSLTALNRKRVLEYAAAASAAGDLASSTRWIVHDGGLMSYAPDSTRPRPKQPPICLLKGARPADLPFEQPTRLRLVIHMKTARTLGLAVPTALLATADEVIE